MQLPEHIKTYPELNLAAIKGKQSRQLRLWYLLRALDPRGDGRVHKQEVQKVLSDILSYESFRRALHDGESIFWETRPRADSGDWIVLRGLPKLCKTFDIFKLSRDPVLIPVQCCKNMAEFRAFIHNSWHTKPDANPISRQVMTKLSGAAKSTQVRYDKATDTQSTENRSLTGRSTSNGTIPEEKRKEGYYTLYLDGKFQEVKHLPNSYYADMQTAPRGRIRHTNRELKACLVGQEMDVHERRYFRNPKSFLRCKHRSEPSYYLSGEYEHGNLWEPQIMFID